MWQTSEESELKKAKGKHCGMKKEFYKRKENDNSEGRHFEVHA